MWYRKLHDLLWMSSNRCCLNSNMEVHSLFLLQSIIHVDSTGASLTCQSTPAYRREHFGFGSKRSLLALFSFLVEREISLYIYIIYQCSLVFIPLPFMMFPSGKGHVFPVAPPCQAPLFHRGLEARLCG